MVQKRTEQKDYDNATKLVLAPETVGSRLRGRPQLRRMARLKHNKIRPDWTSDRAGSKWLKHQRYQGNDGILRDGENWIFITANLKVDMRCKEKTRFDKEARRQATLQGK